MVIKRLTFTKSAEGVSTIDIKCIWSLIIMSRKYPPARFAVYKARSVQTATGRTRGPFGKAKVLTAEQFDYAAEMAAKISDYGPRDQLFIMLSRFCGMRSREIATLHVADVTDATGALSDRISISKRGAKYGKERTVRMRPELAAALKQYLHDTQIVEGPIFWTQRGEPCTPNVVQKQIKRVYEACGYKGARSHSGRRYAITTMAQRANTVGASLEDVRIFAGHAHVTTTTIYIDESPYARELIDFL
jgi:integrase/recombinase XerD